jgi:hypothetical protein
MSEQEPTLREFTIKFDAHEQRDIDRFETILQQFKDGMKVLADKLDEMRHDLAVQVSDHETRLRAVEVSVTRVVTWGSAILVIMGLAEFLLSTFHFTY